MIQCMFTIAQHRHKILNNLVIANGEWRHITSRLSVETYQLSASSSKSFTIKYTCIQFFQGYQTFNCVSQNAYGNRNLPIFEKKILQKEQVFRLNMIVINSSEQKCKRQLFFRIFFFILSFLTPFPSFRWVSRLQRPTRSFIPQR